MTNVNLTQRKLLYISFASFIALGLRAGLLGVSWPSIQVTFSLSLDAVGAYLIAATLGYLLTTSISGQMINKIGLGWYLLLGSTIASVGFAAQALAPTWWTLVIIALLTSVGVAAIDAGLNTYFAFNKSASEMNWLHACFGLGGTISPILMATAINISGSWRWGFVPVAIVYGILAFVFLITRMHWPGTAGRQLCKNDAFINAPRILSTLKLTQVWVGILLFFSFTGLEGSAAQWPYTLFTQSRNIIPETASLWVTLFWASTTAGRIFFGFVVEQIGKRSLLTICIFIVTVASAIFWWNPGKIASFLALTIIGFCISPIFPVTTSMTPDRVGEAHAANAIGLQMAVARLGLSLIPGFVGVLANIFGLEIIPILFFINAILMLILQAGFTKQVTKVH